MAFGQILKEKSKCFIWISSELLDIFLKNTQEAIDLIQCSLSIALSY